MIPSTAERGSDPRVALVSGIKTELLDMQILIFLALIIVISIKVIGIILVSSLVVLVCIMALNGLGPQSFQFQPVTPNGRSR